MHISAGEKKKPKRFQFSETDMLNCYFLRFTTQINNNQYGWQNFANHRVTQH